MKQASRAVGVHVSSLRFLHQPHEIRTTEGLVRHAATPDEGGVNA